MANENHDFVVQDDFQVSIIETKLINIYKSMGNCDSGLLAVDTPATASSMGPKHINKFIYKNH